MNDTAERDNEWGALVRPEVILPAQFFGALRRQRPCQGEQRLMLAILDDALSCFQRYLCAGRRRERQLFWDAEAWLLSEDEAPFSFEHICGVLELDPASIRESLKQWSDRELAARSSDIPTLTLAAASKRSAPVANRPPARRRHRDTRRQAYSSPGDSKRAREATVFPGSLTQERHVLRG